jgi:hypothetical protein
MSTPSSSSVHTLTSVAMGGGRYPATRVVLSAGNAGAGVVLMLHEEGTRRNVAMSVPPALLDDAPALSDLLGRMLDQVWPARDPARLP